MSFNFKKCNFENPTINNYNIVYSTNGSMNEAKEILTIEDKNGIAYDIHIAKNEELLSLNFTTDDAGNIDSFDIETKQRHTFNVK